MILGYVALFGATRSSGADEGAPARIFQLLILVQMPIMAAFAVRWLPRAFSAAFLVLLLQVAAAAVPVVTVIALER